MAIDRSTLISEKNLKILWTSSSSGKVLKAFRDWRIRGLSCQKSSRIRPADTSILSWSPRISVSFIHLQLLGKLSWLSFVTPTPNHNSTLTILTVTRAYSYHDYLCSVLIYIFSCTSDKHTVKEQPDGEELGRRDNIDALEKSPHIFSSFLVSPLIMDV